MNISSTNKQNTEIKLNKVYIYLRNYKKIANLVPVYTPITNRQLKLFVSEQLFQPKQTFTLFINGVRIDAFPEENSNIKNNSIIHVVNLDRINVESLTIYFKFAKESKDILQVKTTPNRIIKQVFYGEILPFFQKNEKQIFLAYLGKPISIMKTFRQQYIEDKCQILLLEFKKEVITMFHSYHQGDNNNNKTVVVGTPNPGWDSYHIASMKKIKKPENKQKDTQNNKTGMQQQKNQFNQQCNCAPSQKIPLNYNNSNNQKKQQTAPPNIIKKTNIPKQIKQQ